MVSGICIQLARVILRRGFLARRLFQADGRLTREPITAVLRDDVAGTYQRLHVIRRCVSELVLR